MKYNQINTKALTTHRIVLIVLTLILVAFAFMTFGGRTMFVFQQSAIYILPLIGLSFVMLIGGIDLSIPGVIALGSAVFVYTYNSSLSILFSAFISIVVCALSGLLSGLIITITKAPPFIVTLIMLMLLSGVAYMITNGLTIRMSNINSVNSSFYIFISLCCAVLAVYFTSTSKYRELASSAISSNSNPKIFLICAIFMLSAILSGGAGVLMTIRIKRGLAHIGNDIMMAVIISALLAGYSLYGKKINLINGIVCIIIFTIFTQLLNYAGISNFIQNIILSVIGLIALILNTKVMNPKDVTPQNIPVTPPQAQTETRQSVMDKLGKL